jgi:hypothetical protein
MAKLKRPRDPNQLAKLIVDISVGEAQDKNPDEKKSRGGRRGGTARAQSLTADQRSMIASIAAQARWKRRK